MESMKDMKDLSPRFFMLFMVFMVKKDPHPGKSFPAIRAAFDDPRIRIFPILGTRISWDTDFTDEHG